jgi:hypothetical protein
MGAERWQEKVYNTEEWKQLLRAAMNRHILCVTMEWMKFDMKPTVYKTLNCVPQSPLGEQTYFQDYTYHCMTLRNEQHWTGGIT